MSNTRYDCALDGVSLSDVSDAIFITDIQEQEPDERVLTDPFTLRSGSRRIRKTRQSLTVTVSFAIGEMDVQRRKDICQKAVEWAKSGRYLTVGDRPGQRLRVVCEALPRLPSAQKWQNVLQMDFTAYSLPYWEDEIPAQVSTGAEGALTVPGDVETVCAVTVQNMGSAAVTRVTLSAGDTGMTFTGLNIPAGKALEIGYNDEMTLYARVGSESVLSKRTEESSDDLLVNGGALNPVRVSADGDVSATFKARGLYE